MRKMILKELRHLLGASKLGPLAKVQAVWPVLVQSPLSRYSMPLGFEGRRLIIAVANPAVAQELMAFESHLVGSFAELDGVVIHSISTRIEAGRFPPAEGHRFKAPVPNAQVTEAIGEALDHVPDAELRGQLQRLSRRRPADGG
ncbi:MAG: hypothetical protein AUK47_16465 [Deltaproteobacteria bacterium CG2_30_63_29]|nr:MAG: hypothetical protein AUK47_16465 [Deltaproteobacteria bacterium CG2_30_63_29]PJB34729.1 MAG: hypothetical protein CO108_27595 [Deltaproteobacteria bacterium CG_4_9_14_3_um_filter_63_12]